MNRYRKEELRKYLHQNIGKLSYREQILFCVTFSARTDIPIEEIIDKINNKVLRRAHNHVYQILKKK